MPNVDEAANNLFDATKVDPETLFAASKTGSNASSEVSEPIAEPTQLIPGSFNSTEDDSEYDYDAIYEYNYETDYQYDYKEDTKEDCNDFSHLIGNDSSHDDNEKDILSDLPSSVYCELINTLETKCLEQSILEIWMYDESTINRLTQEDILFAINKLERSPYFGYSFNYDTLLGSIKRNESGHIVSARSAMHHLVTTVDLDNLSSLGLADAGTEPAAELDDANYQWQWEVINTILEEDKKSQKDVGMNVRVRMTRSYTDVSSAVVFLDMKMVLFCVVIMFIYTSFMLGRFDIVQQRIYLTAAGLISVLLGIVIAIGLTSALGFPYMPHYAILPFIMIGLGIDDMFVIVESWYNLDKHIKETKPLDEQIALTLKDAGVAITVTSVTDICAFSIGCITILPGLKAFCLTCAIGITAVYLLQVSWFVAWLSIDQKRINSRRNGILPCIVHVKVEPKDDKTTKIRLPWKNVGKILFKSYGSLLSNMYYVTFVILATLGLLSCGLYGSLNIRQEYDEIKMLPTNTYLRKWFDDMKTDFPGHGQNVKLFTGALDPSKDLSRLDAVISALEEMKQRQLIIKDVDSWWIKFKSFISQKWNVLEWKDIATKQKNPENGTKTFKFLLSDFLHSSVGGKYKPNIIFNEDLSCNKESPDILATSSDVTYLSFDGPKEHIPSVNHVEELIQSKNFSSRTFTNGRIYGLWEIDKVIVLELWRNLACAIACVFVITFLLLSDIIVSVEVLICVVLTLVDVVGMLYFWNITIDVISCCCIIVIVGLCVDYSAHIAHAFLVSTGNF